MRRDEETNSKRLSCVEHEII